MGRRLFFAFFILIFLSFFLNINHACLTQGLLLKSPSITCLALSGETLLLSPVSPLRLLTSLSVKSLPNRRQVFLSLVRPSFMVMVLGNLCLAYPPAIFFSILSNTSHWSPTI